MNAIVLVISGPEATADTVARLICATLTLNGYNAGAPAVIDWPSGAADGEAPPDEDVPTIDVEEASGLSADDLNQQACGPIG